MWRCAACGEELRGDFPNDDLNVRGLQGFDEDDLVTCRYTTPSGNSVTAIGFFTGRG